MIPMAWANKSGLVFVGNADKWKFPDCVIPLFTHPEKSSLEIEIKNAALRVALNALETAAMNDPAREDDHYYDIAAGAVREALK